MPIKINFMHYMKSTRVMLPVGIWSGLYFWISLLSLLIYIRPTLAKVWGEGVQPNPQRFYGPVSAIY